MRSPLVLLSIAVAATACRTPPVESRPIPLSAPSGLSEVTIVARGIE